MMPASMRASLRWRRASGHAGPVDKLAGPGLSARLGVWGRDCPGSLDARALPLLSRRPQPTKPALHSL